MARRIKLKLINAGGTIGMRPVEGKDGKWILIEAENAGDFKRPVGQY